MKTNIQYVRCEVVFQILNKNNMVLVHPWGQFLSKLFFSYSRAFHIDLWQAFMIWIMDTFQSIDKIIILLNIHVMDFPYVNAFSNLSCSKFHPKYMWKKKLSLLMPFSLGYKGYSVPNIAFNVVYRNQKKWSGTLLNKKRNTSRSAEPRNVTKHKIKSLKPYSELERAYV